MLGLCCGTWSFPSCSEWGWLSGCGVLASLRWPLLLQNTGSRVHRLQQLWHMSSAVAHGHSGPKACGIFSGQGLNSWPLYWQADSYPLATREVLNPPYFLLSHFKQTALSLCLVVVPQLKFREGLIFCLLVMLTHGGSRLRACLQQKSRPLSLESRSSSFTYASFRDSTEIHLKPLFYAD